MNFKNVISGKISSRFNERLRYKAFLANFGRAAVTFSPPTRTVEGKLMKRVPEAPTIENQTNQERKVSEANRRVQFNKEFEVQTLLKTNQQS